MATPSTKFPDSNTNRWKLESIMLLPSPSLKPRIGSRKPVVWVIEGNETTHESSREQSESVLIPYIWDARGEQTIKPVQQHQFLLLILLLTLRSGLKGQEIDIIAWPFAASHQGMHSPSCMRVYKERRMGEEDDQTFKKVSSTIPTAHELA